MTYLIPELIGLVDNEALPFCAGTDFSYLDEPSQRAVYEFFFGDGIYSVDLERSGAIKRAFKENGTVTKEILENLFFKNGEAIERVLPLINRKMLKSLITEVELPDDETLIRLFADFLRDKFGASGSISCTRKTEETIF